MPARRFPPPWSVEEQSACFVVRDHNGQALACIYFEDEPGRRTAAKLLERDEARRIAVNIAKLGAIEPPSDVGSAMRGAGSRRIFGTVVRQTREGDMIWNFSYRLWIGATLCVVLNSNAYSLEQLPECRKTNPPTCTCVITCFPGDPDIRHCTYKCTPILHPGGPTNTNSGGSTGPTRLPPIQKRPPPAGVKQ